MRAEETLQMGEYADKAKGRIKQAAGDLTGNKRLKQEGEVDELKGKAKGVVNDVKRAVRKAAK
jgi:uncharacterized protein YjbJ (UPF0337 family)